VDGPLTSPCRLLALDIDGTLLGGDKTISRRNLDAVEAARRAGVRVVLITGRRYPAARRVAAQLGRGVPLVLHHGALVVEPEPERDHEGAPQVLRCLPLAREAVLEAISLGRAVGADPVAHCGFLGEGRLVVAQIAADNEMLLGYVDRGRRDRVQVGDLERDLPEDVVQVMFAGRLPQMLDLYPRLVSGLGARAKVERTLYPAIGMGFLDVLHPRVGKGEALTFLRERWDIRREETVAIGDNWNDHDMLTAAGRGLVMGNAEQALKELGLEVLPTNDEDGVAVAIERYVLAGPPQKNIRG
jgi:hydroxymethylpyrimidine pyrophosphatase-like HAD family hydrolase